MATEADEAMLREQWSLDRLGPYEGQWIAFRNNEVLLSSPNFGVLSERYLDEIFEGNGPLFAYVTFKVRA